MIMRILGEGQYEVVEEHLNLLNELDAALQSAADAGDEAAYTTALSALLDAVRSLGTPLSDNSAHRCFSPGTEPSTNPPHPAPVRPSPVSLAADGTSARDPWQEQ